jgi:hypothetical protein
MEKMTYESLQAAIFEAKRFLKAAEQVKIRDVVGSHLMAGKKWQDVENYTKESAACKRASMDLTRALARIR